MYRDVTDPDFLSINDVLRQAWELYKVYFPNFISISLLYALFQTGTVHVLNILKVYSLESLLIINLFLSSWAAVVMIETCNKVYQGRQVAFSSNLAAAGRVYLPFIAVTAALFIVMGLGILAVIIPGFYFATVFMFADIIVVAERKKLIESFEKSFYLVKGLFWKSFQFFAVSIFISVIPLGVNSIISLKSVALAKTIGTITAVIVMPYYIIFKFSIFTRLRHFKTVVGVQEIQ